jgi:hypothetical protein
MAVDEPHRADNPVRGSPGRSRRRGLFQGHTAACGKWSSWDGREINPVPASHVCVASDRAQHRRVDQIPLADTLTGAVEDQPPRQ